jgi:DNA-binding transcriptional MerR regulator
MSEPSAFPFNDGKAADAMRTIGEVASGLGIKQHILRYWEQQFPMLRPLKRSGGRRLYRPEDVALVMQIDQLINAQGYTLKGARQVVEGKGDKAAPAAPITAKPVEAPEIDEVQAQALQQLKSIRRRLAAALDAA